MNYGVLKAQHIWKHKRSTFKRYAGVYRMYTCL